MDRQNQPVVTVFKDTMVPEFVVKIKDSKEVEKAFEMPPIKQEFFYMLLSSKVEKLSKFYLQVLNGRIYMRNSPDSPVLAYIDIAYSRLKLLKQVEVTGKVLNGIRFIKNKNYEEILHPDIDVVNEWFDTLKRYCVLSKFREIYTIKNVIGKGNFAKVYICTHYSTKKDYAAKIFDKKLILQDNFERVLLV